MRVNGAQPVAFVLEGYAESDVDTFQVIGAETEIPLQMRTGEAVWPKQVEFNDSTYVLKQASTHHNRDKDGKPTQAHTMAMYMRETPPKCYEWKEERESHSLGDILEAFRETARRFGGEVL